MKYIILCLCCVLTGGVFANETRVWTLANGKTMEAEFVSLFGGKVSLKNSKGKVHKISEGQFSSDDLKYIQQQLPPQLDISFTKKSKQRVFPDSLSDLPRSFYFDFRTKIKQTSAKKYDQELEVELFVIAEEISGGKKILVDYQKSSFYLTEGSGSVFELRGNPVELIDMVIGGQRRGTKFGGYLIAVTDARDEIITYKASREYLFENVENLRKIPVSKTFDENCNRCFPTRPKRFY